MGEIFTQGVIVDLSRMSARIYDSRSMTREQEYLGGVHGHNKIVSRSFGYAQVGMGLFESRDPWYHPLAILLVTRLSPAKDSRSSAAALMRSLRLLSPILHSC